MKHLVDALKRAIRSVQRDVELLRIDEATDKKLEVVFQADKNDGVLFSSRPYQIDDDEPEFIGASLIEDRVQRIVGEDYNVSAYEHQKGLFSIEVNKKAA